MQPLARTHMRTALETRWTARALFVVAGLVAGCPAPDDAGTVRSEFEIFQDSEIGQLRGLRVELEVTDPAGEPVEGSLVLPGDGQDAPRAVSPFPMLCDNGSCSLTMSLASGTYRFLLRVFAKDRCGVEDVVIEGRTDPDEALTVGPGEPLTVSLEKFTYEFDSDGDGIVNVMEPQVCGRFTVEDRHRLPQVCVDEEDPCCADPVADDLAGRSAIFDGFDGHQYIDGSILDVGAIAIDATEVTYAQFARCVAHGACLFGNAGHPALTKVDDEPRSKFPVTGLTPGQASDYCDFVGRRLPTDQEWDAVAAWRPTGRARYPWSDILVDEPNTEPVPGCKDTDVQEGVSETALNYRQTNRGCTNSPTRVGIYRSTAIGRGGTPLVDMAGNVYEWTVRAGTPGEEHPSLPVGAAGVYLRGGSYASIVQLLENDFRVAVDGPADVEDFDRFETDINRLKSQAGFRCVLELGGSVDADALNQDEPACSAP